MRRSISLSIRAGVALALLVGVDRVVLPGLSLPSSGSIVERRGDTKPAGRRGRPRVTVATSVPPTTVAAGTTTTAHVHSPTTATTSPPTTRPSTATTVTTTAAPQPPTTARATTTAPVATTAAATTTTAHVHTPTGSYPTTWTPSPGPRNGEAFVENFDADPLSPQPWQPDNWDIQFHNRDFNHWAAPEPVMGHNSATCGAAPAHHAIATWTDSTYVCLHHLMTAIEGSLYGAIYLTPPAMVDFATEGTISWQNSTLLTSDRDWQDVWISPYADNLATPLYDWLPDLQGEPRVAVHVTRDFGGPAWNINVVRNHVSTTIGRLEEPADLPRTQAGVTGYEIRMTRTGLRFGIPERNLWTSVTFADLGFSAGVVQFGHHSYTPEKNGGTNVANSWSWDSFRIAPTKPLTITRATPRLVTDNGAGITFAPAPANASLRFSGVCAIEMDIGAGWRPVNRQPEEKRSVEHFSSYQVPIPAGTTAARFRFTGEGWYAGFPCAVKDAHVWSAS